MTKCKEDIKANFEKKFGVTLESCEECVQMSDESPEKFKAECKAISEEFQKNTLKKLCENEYPNDQDGQDWCKKYTKDLLTCSMVAEGMGVLVCTELVGCKIAADSFEGEQKTYQDKINDLKLIGGMILCQDEALRDECREKYEYVYQILKVLPDECRAKSEYRTLKGLKEFYEKHKEDDEGCKNLLKEYEEIKSTIDVPTKLMKDIYERVQREIEKCEANERIDREYLKVGDNGELYIKEVLYKFYPELNNSKDIVNKVKNGTYAVEQFGITINNYDNGKNCTLTGRGNINEINNEPIDCFPIPPDSEYTESYNLESNNIVHCGMHIFDRSTNIIISKARGHDKTIDPDKPIVTISQSKPLIISKVYGDSELVKKDGTVSNKKFYECERFYDENGRITDCLFEGIGCDTCKELMWDYQGPEIPVYMHGYSPEML